MVLSQKSGITKHVPGLIQWDQRGITGKEFLPIVLSSKNSSYHHHQQNYYFSEQAKKPYSDSLFHLFKSFHYHEMIHSEM